MNDTEIAVLAVALNRKEKVFWKNIDKVLIECTHVNMYWIEFPDDPNCIAEPAVFFPDGTWASLYCTATNEFFCGLKPFFN